MTKGNLKSMHLCIVPGNSTRPGMRASVSCLRNHPEVRLILATYDGVRSVSRMKQYVEHRLDNPVEVVDARDTGWIADRGDDGGGDAVFVFMPSGDWLSDGALEAMWSSVRDGGADIVYADQDTINGRGHLEGPRFKTGPNYDYFAHFDYIGDLLCIRRSILVKCGGIDLNDYPSARCALLLRAFADGRRIAHLPRPVYHARNHVGGRSLEPVLRAHFREQDPEIEVLPAANNTYRIKRRIRGEPRTTIVIPFKDRPRFLRTCLESILENTSNPNFDILGISNRSQSSETYRVMDEFRRRDRRIRFVEHNIPFNFSALVNHGVDLAPGEYIVLMNNDISVSNKEWLDAMLEHGQRKRVGVVGAKLLYPDGTIQHAGLSVQKSGHIGHMHKHYPGDSPGYMNRLICVQEVSAVTAALCLFTRDLHRVLQGFDEDRFGIAYNDVDFCLRAKALGRCNIFTPFALAYHHESLSRGYEDTESKRSRFERERHSFWQRYQFRLGRPDPGYNPNLDQYRDDFSY